MSALRFVEIIDNALSKFNKTNAAIIIQGCKKTRLGHGETIRNGAKEAQNSIIIT